MEFLALGGGPEIGANSYFLTVDGVNIVLDAGFHPRKKGIEKLPDFSLLSGKRVDSVLISHSHVDHIAALPVLLRQFPYCKVLMTEGSRRLASLVLRDSANIMEKDKEREGTEILYTKDEVKMILNFIIGVEYKKEYKIFSTQEFDSSKVRVEFFESGHILGASAILIKGYDKNIFYTGDICLHNQNVMKAGEIPKEDVDILILEGTYGGDRNSVKNSRRKEIKSFGKKIRTVLERNGSILIPAFAIGRSQEILAIVTDLMEEGRIPPAPIYYGGMCIEVSKIYDISKNTCNNIDKYFRISDIQLREFDSDKLLEGPYMQFPSIVIAPSGMLIETTPSYILAEEFLTNPKHGIFFVGYCDPETPSYLVSNSNKGDVIELNNDSESILIKSDIEKFDFSAHSNKNELLNIVESLNPKKIILVHGDIDSLVNLKNLIEEKYPEKQIIIPQLGISYELNN